MKADELIREGRLDEALAALKEAVRSNPADWRQRVFLFQLLGVRGEWDAARSLGTWARESLRPTQLSGPRRPLRLNLVAGVM